MFVFFAEAVPIVVVLVGLFLLRSRTGAAGVWLDVLLFAWCGVSLLAKQALFVTIASLDWRASAVSGIVLGAALPVMLLAAIGNRRVRGSLAWLLVLGCTGILTLDRLYFSWFGDVFPAIGLLAFRQVGSLGGGVRELLTGRDLVPFIDLLVAAPLIAATWRRGQADDQRPRFMVAAASALLVTVAAWQTAAPIRANPAIVTQRFSNLALVETVGPLPFHGLDSWLVVRRLLANELVDEAVFDEVLHWLEDRAPRRAGTGPLFGAASGKNLIVIQVESLQEPLVNLQINGRDVMPNLRKLAADHIFGPSFWNRRIMHPNLGFFRSYFAADFAPGEAIGWGLNDRDFLMQMMPRLAAARQPFAAWLITLSLHYPFTDFPDRHKILDVTPFEKTGFGNYLHGMHYFDEAARRVHRRTVAPGAARSIGAGRDGRSQRRLPLAARDRARPGFLERHRALDQCGPGADGAAGAGRRAAGDHAPDRAD